MKRAVLARSLEGMMSKLTGNVPLSTLSLFAKKQHSPHLKLLSYSTACIPHGVCVSASEFKEWAGLSRVCLCYQM